MEIATERAFAERVIGASIQNECMPQRIHGLGRHTDSEPSRAQVDQKELAQCPGYQEQVALAQGRKVLGDGRQQVPWKHVGADVALALRLLLRHVALELVVDLGAQEAQGVVLEVVLDPVDAEAVRQRERLIQAYRGFREFEPRWLHLLEPLRAVRFVVYAAWIARRWDDPAFPDAFPHFGTAPFWETETRDLDENTQIDLDKSGNLCALTLEHASERTDLSAIDYQQVTA